MRIIYADAEVNRVDVFEQGEEISITACGGGGTDLPSYYERYGSMFISAAIDKYVYISLHETFSGEFIAFTMPWLSPSLESSKTRFLDP